LVIGTATAGSLAAGCGGGAAMGGGQCMGEPVSTAIIVSAADEMAATKDKIGRVGDTIVYITKDDKGFMAIDSRCQHAGCPTVPEKGADGSYVGFVCGCHGSKYFLDGKVKNGPTVKPLVHASMCRRASDGALAIDLQTPTSIDDRVT
jgi:Rieske Fe-S protein